MKTIKLIITLILPVFAIAQDTIYIHEQRGSIAKFPVDEIDSIVFTVKPSANSSGNSNTNGNEITYGSVTDSRDGNIYKTITIGQQIWMAENLAYLPEVHSKDDFSSNGGDKKPAYGVYGYNGSDVVTAKNENNYATYGVLYNWYVIDQTDVCPNGWHVPSDDEWTNLELFLSENGYAYIVTETDKETLEKIGKALASTTYWSSSIGTGDVGNDLSSNNSSGFTAMPGGTRESWGDDYDLGEYGHWWSRTEYGGTMNNQSICRLLKSFSPFLTHHNTSMGRGQSIRCLKD